MKKLTLLLGMLALAFSFINAQVMIQSFDNGIQNATESSWAAGGAVLSPATGGNTGSYCNMTLSWSVDNFGGFIYTSANLKQTNSLVGTTGLRIFIKSSDIANQGFHLFINDVWKGWFDFSKLTNDTWGAINIPWTSITVDPSTFQITTIALRIAQSATGTSPATIGIDDIQYYSESIPPNPSNIIHSYDNGMQNTTESSWAAGGATLSTATGGNTGSYCNMTLSWSVDNFGGFIYTSANLNSNITMAGTTGLRVYIKSSDVTHQGFHLFFNDVWKGWFDFSKLTNDTWGALDIPWTSISIDPSTFQLTTMAMRIAQDAAGTSPATVGIDNIQYYSDVTGINQVIINQTLKIYPNPVTNGVVNFTEEMNQIYIYNNQGAVVKNIENAKSINVSDLATGIYFVKTSKGQAKLFIQN